MGVQRVQREESEASGDTNYFSRITDLTSQTLSIGYFYSFAEISPKMSVYNVSHLKCIMVGKRMQKLKNGVGQGAGENQTAVLGFLEP